MGEHNLNRRRVVKGLTSASWLLGALVLATPKPAVATPGAHPPLMSTPDTRASSVILAYRQSMGPLTGRLFSYNANFSSTGGILSAQFGAHVLQLQESADTKTLLGAAATGAAVWSIPLTQRFDNGVPKAAVILYAGGAPTAAVSGKRNFLNVPIGLGIGAALSPATWVSITPWFEAAPGVDLDTTIVEPDLSSLAPDNSDIQQLINGQEAVLVSEEDIKKAIADSVKVDISFEMAMRAGLDINLRMSESWSFNLNSYLSTLGSSFGGQKYIYAGGGLVFHWDDIVPAVLPPSRRLERESCEDIETRFRMCPAGKITPPPPPPEKQCPTTVAPLSPKVTPGPVPVTPLPPPATTSEPAPTVPPLVPGTPSDKVAPPPAPPPAATPAPAPSGNLPPSSKFPEPTPAPPGKDPNALPSTSAPY